MSSFVDLRFSTPSGLKTATVFTDDSGCVTSEHGLDQLLHELKRRKKLKTPPSIDPAVTEKFFDFSTAAASDLEEMRQNYLRETTAARIRGCSKCEQSAIYRKYAAAANKIHG